MAMNGASVLVLVDTDPYQATPTGSAVYESVAEQTGVSWESTTNLISADSKDSNHTKWLPGKQDDTFSLESAYVPSDNAYKALKSAKAAGDLVTVRRSEDGAEVEEASAYVSSISADAPDNDRATTSIEFQLNEAWTTVV